MSFDRLVETIQQRSHGLTPSQRRLAERILRDPDAVAFMSTAELAGLAGVNQSTVVRFANALGLDGYLELRQVLRAHLRRQAKLLEHLDTTEQLTAELQDPLRMTAQLDRSSIARSLTAIDQDAWARAVSALASAPAVHILGLRQSYAAAFLLSYLLGLVRERVTELGTPSGVLLERLRAVGEGDVVVAISIRPYTRDTVRAAAWAAERGAIVIALTDSPASPLTARSACSFFVQTSGIAVLQSVTALTSLVQALAGAAALVDGRQTRSTVSVEHELLERFDVHWQDPA